ncbi:MAG: formate C-acetyltransferase/glycerol dehydratase family glycyl radical enzyme [Bacteroidetes bacterium HGW-Bacteroidetes-9]|nr:MAG: formate C-acetyltransferase/glycerol dehydratase family glycyl radical enzyme [Bacteroidetes bacterium HGW-Bacteroidetes-9]
MNPRITKLREASLAAIPRISGERARLITTFYKLPAIAGLPIPVQRGKALLYLMQNKALHIGENELIVGERSPAPKEVPTYPEVCVHSLQDLEILDSRPKVSYKVDEETRQLYQDEIIPYWPGQSVRDRMFRVLPEAWKEAYSAGVFTEFMEQRAPGHTVAGEKVFRKGMLDLIQDIDDAVSRLDFLNDPEALSKSEELEGMRYACEAMMVYATRNADVLEQLVLNESDPQRRDELLDLAAICRKVPAHAPETFHEALQHYWFIHLGVITELNPWDSFNPGRLDQHLLPFYRKEIAEGSLTKERATELLQAFWIKFNNHPAPPKVGVTAQESNTYTDFCLINVGGVKADGSDAVNELSYLILDVIEEMRLLQPSSMVQLSKKNPDQLIHRAAKIVKTGFGQPSIFNTDAIVQELIRQGKTPEDARRGGASGCVEAGAFGTEAYILTGYFNLPKILELTLNNGVDPLTGKQLGPKTGNLMEFNNFEEFMSAYRKMLKHFIDIKIGGSNIIEKIWASRMPAPFLSTIIDDCIANGRDYNAGGARYNTSYIQGVGLGTMTDCLTSIKHNVFDNQRFTMKQLLEMINADFEGFDQELAELIYDTPKYGNDDDFADQHVTEVFEAFFNVVDGRKSPRGATYRVEMLPTTCHVYFGSKIKALPDGRKAGKPVSEGISPVQGADRRGPTAVIKSAAKFDHIKTGGTLLNQKFSPSFFKDEEAIRKIGQLVRAYFRMDGHHIQFNVVSAETLRKAQVHPEKYSNLIVRVAGYSDYFNDLTPELQEEIICRTEQESD